MQKKIILALLVLVVATFFWISAERWVHNPVWSLSDVDPWLTPLIALVLLSSSLGLAFMLVSEFWIKLSISVVSVIPFVGIFGLHPIYFGAAAIMVLTHMLAISRIADEVKSRIQINAKHIVRRGMSMIILPHLLLISFAYYQSPEVQKAGLDQQLPPAIKRAVENAASTFLTPELEGVPPAQRERVQGQLISEVIRQITNLVKPYFHYLPPVLAFGVFLALQGLSPIFYELSALLVLGLFALLKFLKFLTIEERDTKAQVLKL